MKLDTRLSYDSLWTSHMSQMAKEVWFIDKLEIWNSFDEKSTPHIQSLTFDIFGQRWTSQDNNLENMVYEFI